MTANRDLAVCDHGCDMTRLITLLTWLLEQTTLITRPRQKLLYPQCLLLDLGLELAVMIAETVRLTCD